MYTYTKSPSPSLRLLGPTRVSLLDTVGILRWSFGSVINRLRERAHVYHHQAFKMTGLCYMAQCQGLPLALCDDLTPISARSGSFSQAFQVTLYASDPLPPTPSSQLHHHRRDSPAAFDFGLRVVGVRATADAPQVHSVLKRGRKR